MSVEWPDPVAAYDDLVTRRPELFRNREDALVHIVTQKSEREGIERQLRARCRAGEQPEHWALAGKFYEDAWLMMLRDVVRFPNSEIGTYHRMVLKDGLDSVVIVPSLGDRFVLIRHFRHALRGWSLELPRGHVDGGKTIEDAARAELSEELGAEVVSLKRLGMVQSDTSLTCNPMHIVRAELGAIGAPNRTEGIESVRLVTRDELIALLSSGAVNDVVSVAALGHALFLAPDGNVA